ncbi:hypothetical protein D3C80_1003930 [compost metagenome]
MQLAGDHLPVFGRCITLRHCREQFLQGFQRQLDLSLAVRIIEYPKGDALGPEVFADVIEAGDFLELFRAQDGVVQCTPAAEGDQ